MPSESSSPEGERVHKWLKCHSCGHPEHSMRCMVMVDDTGDNCRCLALTPADQIVVTCRYMGGCPDHPTKALPHVHEWGDWAPDKLQARNGLEYAWCPCGASKARRAEEGVCVCGHPEGDHRAGHEEPHDGCNWCKKEQCGGYRTEAPPDTACTCSSRLENAEGEVIHSDDCPAAPELEDWPCGDCGAMVSGGLEWCPKCPSGEPRAPAPRRPPYAVAYAVEGGALYEVALSGDATVVAEDGVLQIIHPSKAVLGITRVTPMYVEERSADDGAQ